MFQRSPGFPFDPLPGEHILSGVYDLRRVDFDHSYEGRASFENAEMWAAPNCQDVPCIAIAIVFDADEILNLEGLMGVQLPIDAPFDVYRFTGTVQSGLPINLFAAVLGSWMYVRGHSEPALDMAGISGLSVHWLARTSPFADLNSDGVVDTADYVMLRHAQASGGASIGSFQDGTARISYEDWQQQFGETIPDLIAMDAALSAAAGAGALAAAAVPEPTTALAAVIGFLTLALRLRRFRA